MNENTSKHVPGLKEAYHLTKKQEAVLNFIQGYTEKNGCSPSQAEIQRHFGYKSPNSVEGYLRALRKSGVISSTPGKAAIFSSIRSTLSSRSSASKSSAR